MNAVTKEYASTHFPSLMTKVIENSDPTYVCDEEGHNVVLISQDDFDAMQETLYLLSNSTNANRLKESIQELQEGKATTRELIEE